MRGLFVVGAESIHSGLEGRGPAEYFLRGNGGDEIVVELEEVGEGKGELLAGSLAFK